MNVGVNAEGMAEGDGHGGGFPGGGPGGGGPGAPGPGRETSRP